jgi:hypothetical protein
MKQIWMPFAVACITASLFSCKKDAKTTDAVDQATLSQIAHLGFSTTNVQKIDEGYLVEGDIILTENNLNETVTSPTLRIADNEQYRTTNLVKGLPRTITVSVSGSPSTAFSVAVDSALRRYNNQNLQLTFQRVASGGAINIRMVNTGQYIASSGFPTSSGDPYFEVKYANKYANYSLTFVATVLTHEIGHCIGFRHTDYMNRAFSCGSGGNEGDGGVGAILIPGTPSDPERGSWMLACLSSTSNRPFTPNDVTALTYLY